MMREITIVLLGIFVHIPTARLTHSNTQVLLLWGDCMVRITHMGCVEV